MSRNITNRPGSAATVRNTLSASEKLLGDGGKAIKDILDAKAAGAGFTPFNDQEVDQLVQARELILRGRLRNEFPILARVFEDTVDNLVKSGKDGDAKGFEFTSTQTAAMLELMSDLSFAENEALNRLQQLGVIPQGQWDTIVKDARTETNAEHTKLKNQAKWGLASFGNMMSPAAIAIGLGSVVSGGAVGIVGAMALSTVYAMTAGKRIQGSINAAALKEGKTQGMNAAQGREVLSEVTLLAARAAGADIFENKGGSLKDRLAIEVELGEMISFARQQSGVAFNQIEQPFVDMAVAYTAGLPDILEKLESGKLDEAGARQALVDLRADVCKPEHLDAVTKTILQVFVADKDGQQLILLQQMAQAGKMMLEGLEEGGGKPDADVTQFAGAMTMLKGVVGQQGLKSFTEDGQKLVDKLAQGESLSPMELKAFKKEVVQSTSQSLADNEGKLKLTNKEAKKQAVQAFDILWGQVVPSFQELSDPPVAKKMKAEKNEDGNWTVTGKFEGGILGFGSEGDFEIVIGAMGGIDVENMSIDLGEDFMKGAAKEAMKQYGSLIGEEINARDAFVVENKGVEGGYDMGVKLKDGRTANLSISSMGMVDWGSVSIAS